MRAGSGPDAREQGREGEIVAGFAQGEAHHGRPARDRTPDPRPVREGGGIPGGGESGAQGPRGEDHQDGAADDPEGPVDTHQELGDGREAEGGNRAVDASAVATATPDRNP